MANEVTCAFRVLHCFFPLKLTSLVSDDFLEASFDSFVLVSVILWFLCLDSVSGLVSPGFQGVFGLSGAVPSSQIQLHQVRVSSVTEHSLMIGGEAGLVSFEAFRDLERFLDLLESI